MKYCPECENYGDEFCYKCGKKTEDVPTCNYCKERLSPYKKFCSSCGRSREVALAPKPPDPPKPPKPPRPSKPLFPHIKKWLRRWGKNLAIAILPGAVVALTIIWYVSSTPDRYVNIPILSGNYTLVDKILDGEILVGDKEFLKLATTSSGTFVDFEWSKIVYMVKKDGVSYRYEQDLQKSIPGGYDSFKRLFKLEEGVVSMKFTRSWGGFVFPAMTSLITLFFYVRYLIRRKW